MGLLEQEIKEIREMAKGVMSGKITSEQASLQIGFFNQTSKRVSQMIQIAALEVKGKEGRKAYNNMVKSNVIGDGDALQIEKTGDDLIVCPESGGKCVTREQCLEYSGDSDHINVCQDCDHFSTTRKYCFGKVD